jgi:hemoglobin
MPGQGIYEVIGGERTCRQLAEALYARIPYDPALRHFFPGKSHRCAIEAFSAFLVQFLGGPSEHSEFRYFLSLRESHARFQIGAAEREAWLRSMDEALNEVSIPDSARSALRDLFHHASAYLINAKAPPVSQPLADRWQRQRAIDGAIAAIRWRDMARATAMITALDVDRAVRCGLIEQVVRGFGDAAIEFLRVEISRDPELVHATYNSRTLLHSAAASGSVNCVALLLERGARVAMPGHTPLYAVANGCARPGGGEIVRMLVRAGADVNACDNVKRCTPLHMAARRGNVEIARALLDCGADIEAHDTNGVTPLGRARNLKKKAVAELLAARARL